MPPVTASPRRSKQRLGHPPALWLSPSLINAWYAIQFTGIEGRMYCDVQVILDILICVAWGWKFRNKRQTPIMQLDIARECGACLLGTEAIHNGRCLVIRLLVCHLVTKGLGRKLQNRRLSSINFRGRRMGDGKTTCDTATEDEQHQPCTWNGPTKLRRADSRLPSYTGMNRENAAIH
jgi:hypothetical protein